MKKDWTDHPDWLYRVPNFDGKRFPAHGSEVVMHGKLTGITDTDNFHFMCPNCRQELDNHLKGVRKDLYPDKRGICPTIVLGESCTRCGLNNLIKIPCVSWGDPTYQARLVPEGFQLDLFKS